MFFLIFYALVFIGTSNLHADSMTLEENKLALSDECMCLFAPQHSLLYLTGNNSENPTFSLCSIQSLMNKKGISLGFKAEGLVPETVTLDYEKETPNPLYKQKINNCVLLENRPVVVTQQNPNTLFYIHETGRSCSVLATPVLQNALGEPCGGVAALAVGSSFSPAAKNFFGYIVAAVQTKDGKFGMPGSGFALIKLDNYKHEVEVKNDEAEPNTKTVEKEPKKMEVTRYFLNPLDAQTGQNKENKALAIEKVIEQLSINDGLDPETLSVADMHWNPRFGRCYIGFQATTKANATQTQGVCALASATISEDKLIIQPMTYHTAVQGATSSIGATGPNKTVSVHFVRSMQTSTGLSYIIVVGGNGSEDQTKKSVAALPLLVAQNNDVIAARQSAVQPLYRGHPPVLFDHREFIQAAEQPLQMPQPDDKAVRVGADCLLPSAICAINVVYDAVYVTVEPSQETGESAVYHSQPIFDDRGAIAAWTPWQRVVVSDVTIVGADLNPADGSFMLVEKETTQEGTQVLMRKTGWKQGDILDVAAEKDGVVDLAQQPQTLDVVINSYFESDEGGVQGLFDIPAQHPALGNVALVVATGYKKVCVAQTGCMINGVCRALYEPVIRTFSDATLDELGPLNAATIAHDGTQAWLFVAGADGLAVLCNPDGSGWSLRTGLQDGLQALDGMSFKKIGQFFYVQKLMSVGTNLYVVSQSKLERIPLANQNVPQAVQTICCADGTDLSGALPAGLCDAVVSDDCAVLATTQGLFIGDLTTKITTWRPVPLPLEDEIVTRLFTVSPTGFEDGFNKQGQLYVVTESQHEKSHVYRFYAHQQQLVPVPDHFKMTRNHDFFCSLGVPTSFFVTDGSLYICTNNKTSYAKVDVNYVPDQVIGGRTIRNVATQRARMQFGTAERVTAVTRNSATGGWMIAGDFGLRITQ